MTPLIPSPQAVLWVLAAVLAVWGASVAWRGWGRGRGGWMVVLGGLFLQPAALVLVRASAGVPGGTPMPFWWLAGWTTIYFGGLVCFAGVRRDPSRGRPRCPRCWYDLSGAAAGAAPCPECGRQVRSPRDLYRSRPSRALVALGLVILLGSYGVFTWERIRARPLLGIVPTTVLIAGMPWLPKAMIADKATLPGAPGTLLTRHQSSPRNSMTRRLVRARARGLVEAARGDLAAMAPALAFLDSRADADLRPGVQMAVARAFAGDSDDRALALTCSRWSFARSHDELAGRIDHLVPGLTAGLDDVGVEWACAEYLAQCAAAAEPAVDRLLKRVEEASQRRHFMYAMPLRDIARQSAVTRRKMVDKARSTCDAQVRDALIFALGGEGITDPHVKGLLLEDLRGPDDARSRRAAQTLGRQKTADAAEINAIMEQWHAGRPEPERYLSALGRLGEPAWRHYHIAVEQMGSRNEDMRSVASTVIFLWVRDGWDPAPAEPAIRRLAESDDSGIALTAELVLRDLRQILAQMAAKR